MFQSVSIVSPQKGGPGGLQTEPPGLEGSALQKGVNECCETFLKNNSPGPASASSSAVLPVPGCAGPALLKGVKSFHVQ